MAEAAAEVEIASPWAEVRARHPGAVITRWINRDEDTQVFLRVDPALAGRADVDGRTYYQPPVDHLSLDEIAEIEARFDALWHERRTTA